MNLVEKVTDLLQVVTHKKLARAEKRNRKAINRVKSAKADVEKTQFEYRKAQADTLIQLTKLKNIEADIKQKALVQDQKAKNINALLQTIDD